MCFHQLGGEPQCIWTGSVRNLVAIEQGDESFHPDVSSVLTLIFVGDRSIARH